MNRNPAIRMSRRRTALAALAFAALLLPACRRAGSDVLGVAPAGTAVTVGTAMGTPTRQPVTVAGVMVEKCPVAGCWFVLKDDSGSIKVDTKSAGFVVVDVPVGTRITVGGRVDRDGTQSVIAADGIRY